ncbi:MAG TPA: hypothetical protein VJ844_04505 [Mucilaginibacter sp.]|nr:hypothetical protein [Mucilaginibacter sp.]
MNTVKLIRIHASILIACSIVGLSGFYLQYHFFQVTACIPATVGLVLMIICSMQFENQKLKYGLLFLVTLVFGIILTRMSVKFIPQEFQPLRKRIYFPVMALSSIIAVILIIRNYSKYRSN